MPVVVVVLAGSLLLSSAALATLGYAKRAPLAPAGGFSIPVGVAVDNSVGLTKGDIYVSNENGVMDQFSSSGELLTQVQVPGLTELTVDDYAGVTEGDVYGIGSNGVLYRFAPGLGSSEEVVSGLTNATDVAVDQAGNIFVTEQSVAEVLEFNSAGEPIDASGSVVATGENIVIEVSSPDAVAVDASGTDLYVSTFSHVGTVEYTLVANEYSAGLVITTNKSKSAALSASGDIYIDEVIGSGGNGISQYQPSGALVTTFGESALSEYTAGVALSEEVGDVYVADHDGNAVQVFEPGEIPVMPATEGYSQLNGEYVVLNGALAGGATSYHFAYDAGPACEGPGGHATSAVAVSGSSAAQKVQVEVGGLSRFTDYSFCLVAENKYGSIDGAALSFETGQVQPKIKEVSVLVGIETATVKAQVNPEGAASTYYVEYGPSLAYGSKTAEVAVGEGEAPVAVLAALVGLQPSSPYHYRVVAVNEAGSVDSPDSTFTTYAAINGLPDGRVYEMVTPPDNVDANVHGPGPAPAGIFGTGEPFESSENGNAVAYLADPTEKGGNGKTGDVKGNQYLAFRSSQGGWRQVNVDPLGDETVAYEAFSSDLSTGIFWSNERGQEGNREIYTRDSANESISPISNVAAPYRHGHGLVGEELQDFEPFYAGASSDLSHMLVEANDDLLPDQGTSLESELNNDVKAEVDQITPLDEEWIRLGREYQELHEREGQNGSGTEAKGVEVNAKQEEIEALQGTDDHPELYVSVGGSLSLVNVSPEGTVVQGATFGGPKATRSHVISTDGSRIFWSSVTEIPLNYAPGAGGKKVRLRPKAVYVREGGARTVQVSAGPAQFWTASPDGRFAFYIETGKLWRFDVENETRRELAGASEGVQAVVAVNETGEDGAYVYYVATEALAGVENDAKQVPVEGSDNLYLQEPDPEHPGQHKTVFIATLASEEDNNDWSGNIAVRQARATPSGETLAFMANENLTNSSYPREGAPEAYVFDAQDDSLICASCRAQASGGELPADNNALLLPQWISENGDRVFFDSEAPLVWHDINGTMDVYEWERAGSGECREEAGCVYLISGGREGPAEFVGASVSGNDVFFVTRQRLSPQDGNENVDLYDARVGGVEAVSPPVCEGTACQGIPSPPPVFATPASVTFSGVGNFTSTVAPKSVVKTKARALTRKQKLTRALKQCRKQRAKGMRAACEGRARKRYETKTMGSGKSASKREGK